MNDGYAAIDPAFKPIYHAHDTEREIGFRGIDVTIKGRYWQEGKSLCDAGVFVGDVDITALLDSDIYEEIIEQAEALEAEDERGGYYRD